MNLRTYSYKRLGLRLVPTLVAGAVLLGGCEWVSDIGRFSFDGGTGPSDATTGTSAPSSAPQLVAPVNGAYTGSVMAPNSSAISRRSLRPYFVWRPVVGATSYDLELDDNCLMPSRDTCTFPSPVQESGAGDAAPSGSGLRLRPSSDLDVSTTAPVGRAYAWRVRACNTSGCGPWSAVRYLNVGRLEDDFNGDGYGDLIVGALFQDNGATDEGNVFIYYGSALGILATPDRALDNPTNQVEGEFGRSVAAVGDLDGDGYADLIVGAEGQSNGATREGNAFVFYGGPGGVPLTPDRTLDNPANHAGAEFGGSVAGLGDVNGDGYADLIVGAMFQDNGATDEGNAFIYYGSAMGVGSAPSVTLDNPWNESSAEFGTVVAGAGDLNGDGYADVVVGAKRQGNVDQGSAFVYYGASAGVDVNPSVTLNNPVAQASADFGGAVAGAGDLNGDGYDELVVGAYRQSAPANEEGNAFVYHGSADGITSSADQTLDCPGNGATSLFGSAVAGAGDLDGDGFDDLIVGAHAVDDPVQNAGKAFIYLGGPAHIALTPDRTLANPSAQSGLFGVSVASAGDLDGDGYADLVIGAQRQANPSPTEGNAFVFYGGPSGVPAAPDVTLDNPTNESGAFFGHAIARATTCLGWPRAPTEIAVLGLRSIGGGLKLGPIGAGSRCRGTLSRSTPTTLRVLYRVAPFGGA